MTNSTLEITPRVTARGAVSTAETAPTTGVPTFGPAGWHAFHRTTQPDYFGWLDHIRAAAGCTRPIRLRGTLDTVDSATGARLDRRHTDTLPDHLIYKACGNRRATLCPACARTYQRDAFQLLRAGLVGGKGVPETVSQHPAVFVTLTAPSFGLVHRRVIREHTCTDRRRCDCRPDPCRARRPGTHPGVCEHGQDAVCFARHDRDDARLGRPFCLDCYDHDHQVVWNLYAAALWHRTKQNAERYLAQLAKQRGIPPVYVMTAGGKLRPKPPVRLSHGKAAEFQVRGAVHFHALLRLDGIDPQDPAKIVPPPPGFTTLDLDDAIRYAAAHTTITSPAHRDHEAGWPIVWGDEGKGAYADVRHITLTGRGEVTDGMVAGYLAKYATKSTEITGYQGTRITPDTIDQYADEAGEHTARLVAACWRLGRPRLSLIPSRDKPVSTVWSCRTCGTRTCLRACPVCEPGRQPEVVTEPANSTDPNPYLPLRRWAHMLGFGGHFLTKARRYSVTFGLLRATRVDYRRSEDRDQADPGTVRAAEHVDEETTLIVGTLTFAGVGWHNTGDALLANTSAAMARARRDAACEELAHEIGTTLTTADTVSAA